MMKHVLSNYASIFFYILYIFFLYLFMSSIFRKKSNKTTKRNFTFVFSKKKQNGKIRDFMKRCQTDLQQTLNHQNQHTICLTGKFFFPFSNRLSQNQNQKKKSGSLESECVRKLLVRHYKLL